MIDPNRFWRTLIRVVVVDGGGFFAVLPGWDPHSEVYIRTEEGPPFTVKQGDRVHARVNIDAGSRVSLKYRNWEPN
jgi:hypothetical protein